VVDILWKNRTVAAIPVFSVNTHWSWYRIRVPGSENTSKIIKIKQNVFR
jgi:hypothetical protein